MSHRRKGTEMTTRSTSTTTREISVDGSRRSGVRPWQVVGTAAVAALVGLAIAVPLQMRVGTHTTRQSSRNEAVAGPVTAAIQQAHLRSEEAADAAVTQAGPVTPAILQAHLRSEAAQDEAQETGTSSAPVMSADSAVVMHLAGSSSPAAAALLLVSSTAERDAVQRNLDVLLDRNMNPTERPTVVVISAAGEEAEIRRAVAEENVARASLGLPQRTVVDLRPSQPAPCLVDALPKGGVSEALDLAPCAP